MKKPNLEIYFKSDRNLITEDRFMLRRWLQNWVISLNDNLQVLDWTLADNFETYGLTNDRHNKLSFVSFLQEEKMNGRIEWIRIPELFIKKKKLNYSAVGSVEIFSPTILTFEGEIDMVLDKSPEDAFVINFLTFYPRMKVQL